MLEKYSLYELKLLWLLIGQLFIAKSGHTGHNLSHWVKFKIFLGDEQIKRFRESKFGNRKIRILTALMTLCGIAVILIVILVLLLYPFEVDPAVFFPERNCRGDGFSVLYYNHTNRVNQVIF